MRDGATKVPAVSVADIARREVDEGQHNTQALSRKPKERIMLELLLCSLHSGFVRKRCQNVWAIVTGAHRRGGASPAGRSGPGETSAERPA